MVDAERFHIAVLDVRLDEADEDNDDSEYYSGITHCPFCGIKLEVQ